MNKIKLTLIIGFGLSSINYAQVSFGRSDARGASLIDFGKGNINGIVLPYHYNTVSPVEGTFRVNLNNSKIQYYDGHNWIDLTEQGSINVEVNTNEEIASNNGIIITDKKDVTNHPKGILVLESDHRTITLPHVDRPHQTIVDPPIGMMCYDSFNKVIAIFNGNNWSFYK